MITHVQRALTLALLLLLVPFGPSSRAVGQTPDAAAKFRLAQGLENAGENEQALALYRELYLREPRNVVYFEGLQRVLTRQKRYDELAGLIRERLRASPGDLGLWGQLGSAYYRGGDEARARAAWDSAIAMSPGNPAVYRFVANVMIENRLLEQAAESYRRGRQACGDPSLFAFELSHLLAMSMDYRGATEELVRWLENNPGQTAVVQSRLSAFTGSGEGRAGAIEAVRQAIERTGDTRFYDLLSWLYLEGKEYRRALEVVVAVEGKTGGGGATMLAFADRAYSDRAFAIAAEAYDLALAASLPRARVPGARYGRAMALLGMAASVDTTAQPLILTPIPGTEQLSRYAASVAAFQRVVEEFPRSDWSARAYYQIGLVQLRHLGDPERALDSFRRAAEEAATTPAFQYGLALKTAEAFMVKGDSAGAAARYRTVAAARNATPDQMDEAAFRLAELDYFAGRIAEARTQLDSITLNLKADYANDALQLRSFLQESGGAPVAALGRFGAAEYLARQRRNPEAAALLRDLLRSPEALPLAEEALIRVALLEAGMEFYERSAATLAELLGRPGHQGTGLDRAQFMLGEVQEFGLKNRTAAIAAYEKLLLDHPRSVWGAPARQRIRTLRGSSS